MMYSEQHPYFPSGDWEGFYNDFRGGGKKGEMSMTLDFSNGIIRGAGSDPLGAYSWTGTYNTKAETCQLTKTYVGRHSVVYTGYADENGIWGKWKTGSVTGDFHIWPKKNGSDGDAEEEKEAMNSTIRKNKVGSGIAGA